jgi:tetratricopeptide (TPR) repeat protein
MPCNLCYTRLAIPWDVDHNHMTGRKDLFDESMQLGHSAAWDSDWERAIEFYRKALAEYPENTDALNSLGLALLETEKYKDALDIYHRASQLNPGDPIPVEKSGEILERMGQIENAISQRNAAAELHLQRRDAEKTIENWSHVARMSPTDMGTRYRLAVTYERMGRHRDAVYEYLAVASILQDSGKQDRAVEAIQRALRIVPGDKEASKALKSLQKNEELPPPPAPRGSTSPLRIDQVKQFLKAEELEEIVEKDDEQADPEAVAQTQALTILAGLLFDEPTEAEDGSGPLHMAELTGGQTRKEIRSVGQPQMYRYLGLAIDLQTRGNERQAITEYQRANKAGLDHPAAHYNLGILLKNLGEADEAKVQLTKSLGHPELDLGANLALGRLARMQGDTSEAARYLLQALRRADSLSVEEGQSSELNQLYDTILASLNEGDEESLSQIVENTLNFLSGPEWLYRLRQARRQLEGEGGGVTLVPIADMLAVGGTERVIESIGRIDDLISKKKYMGAMEEAMLAMDYVPSYLALHSRMAEILIMTGHVDSGMTKLQTIAKTHFVRGEIPQATAVFDRIVQHNPIDTKMRKRMIDLLAQQDRVEEALEQYLELVEIFRQMADLESAQEMLVEAYNLSQRGPVEKKWTVQILDIIGDIKLSRLEWRQALEAYQEICALDSGNQEARARVIDLNLRLGKEGSAAEALDTQLEHLVQEGKGREALALLEDLAREYPGKQVLHSRLAEAYRAAGRTADAIAQYDALGEIQLDAGQVDEATRTIQTIIELDPPNLEGYQELLKNLEAGK